MQNSIHPTWYHDATVTCACGSVFTTGSTKQSLQVDICSKCHPFFTGEMRFVDRQGRVDKFRQRMEFAQKQQAQVQARQAAKVQQTTQTQTDPQSYKQVLQQQKESLKKTQTAAA